MPSGSMRPFRYATAEPDPEDVEAVRSALGLDWAVSLAGDDLLVSGPYEPKLVPLFKRARGRWDPHRRVWVFSGRTRVSELARALRGGTERLGPKDAERLLASARAAMEQGRDPAPVLDQLEATGLAKLPGVAEEIRKIREESKTARTRAVARRLLHGMRTGHPTSAAARRAAREAWDLITGPRVGDLPQELVDELRDEAAAILAPEVVRDAEETLAYWRGVIERGETADPTTERRWREERDRVRENLTILTDEQRRAALDREIEELDELSRRMRPFELLVEPWAPVRRGDVIELRDGRRVVVLSARERRIHEDDPALHGSAFLGREGERALSLRVRPATGEDVRRAGRVAKIDEIVDRR